MISLDFDIEDVCVILSEINDDIFAESLVSLNDSESDYVKFIQKNLFINSSSKYIVVAEVIKCKRLLRFFLDYSSTDHFFCCGRDELCFVFFILL